MPKQEVNVIVHYPKTVLGFYQLTRHAVAVKELLDLDRAGMLEGQLSQRVRMLDTEQEDEAFNRYLKAHPRRNCL